MIDCECYWPNSRQRWIQRAVERWKKIIVKKTSFQFAPGKHKPQCQQHLMQLLRQCFRMCWWNHSRQYCNQFGMHWRHYIRQHPQHNMNSVQVLPIELHCSNHNIEAIKKEQIFWCHINERCYASYAFCDKIYPRIVCRKVQSKTHRCLYVIPNLLIPLVIPVVPQSLKDFKSGCLYISNVYKDDDSKNNLSNQYDHQECGVLKTDSIDNNLLLSVWSVRAWSVQFTYRYSHAMGLFNSSTASKECNNEDDGTDYNK